MEHRVSSLEMKQFLQCPINYLVYNKRLQLIVFSPIPPHPLYIRLEC